MKTVREWLSEGLLREHYGLLLKYHSLCDWDITITLSLPEALMRSILWEDTKEGYAFWMSIYHDILYDRYNKYSNNIFIKL